MTSEEHGVQVRCLKPGSHGFNGRCDSSGHAGPTRGEGRERTCGTNGRFILLNIRRFDLLR